MVKWPPQYVRSLLEPQSTVYEVTVHLIGQIGHNTCNTNKNTNTSPIRVRIGHTGEFKWSAIGPRGAHTEGLAD